LAGYAHVAFHGSSHGSPAMWDAQDAANAAWQFMDFRGFFGNPATWLGLGLGVAMVAAAIQMRMRRSDI